MHLVLEKIEWRELMINRMRHYHKCVLCNNLGVAYHIVGFDIDTIMCKSCLEKFINKISEKE